MAREAKVTRTFKVTKVGILAINLETAEPYNDVIKLTKAPKNEKQLMKKIEKLYNNEEQRAVKIVSVDTETKLYGMTEEKFLAEAEEMPLRKPSKK